MKIDIASGLEIVGDCIEDPRAAYTNGGKTPHLSCAKRLELRKHLGIDGNRSMVIDHICNNGGCINPDHVRAVTQSENIKAAYVRGTKVPPDRQKYSDGFIRVMLILHMNLGRSHEYIFENYGVNQPTLSNWRRGHRRGHIIKDLIARGFVAV